MLDPALAACAPFVAPATLAAVARVESAGKPLAINVNKGPRVPTPANAADAARTARYWIGRGHSVDLGLMQVNSRNLGRLGVTVEQMFDPCLNIRAGATILAENYATAANRRGHGQNALMDALSAYNTGSFTRGYSNGYVGRYLNMPHANIRIGAMTVGSLPPVADPYSAELAVFTRKEDPNARGELASPGEPQPASLD